jgi:hypothetical protein
MFERFGCWSREGEIAEKRRIGRPCGGALVSKDLEEISLKDSVQMPGQEGVESRAHHLRGGFRLGSSLPQADEAAVAVGLVTADRNVSAAGLHREDRHDLVRKGSEHGPLAGSE